MKYDFLKLKESEMKKSKEERDVLWYWDLGVAFYFYSCEVR